MKKTLKNTKETTETDFSCEFCNAKFARERTVLSHICETKNRWLHKDNQSNRIAFQVFTTFYTKHSPTKQQKTYRDFIKSPYYMAFIKFANYCIDVKCINILRFSEWLLKNNIKIDNWNTDSNYTKFILDYLKTEDPFDAIKRSIEYCMDMCVSENLQHHDYLRYGNSNKICHAIATGRISPWLLYCSESGVRLLDTLNPDHVKIVIDYIKPEQWALRFHRESDITNQIKQLLKDARY
jgi:hypothetical protein